MKKFFILVLLVVTVSFSAEASNWAVTDYDPLNEEDTSNKITNKITNISLINGGQHLRIEYDRTGMFGTARLMRAVQPNGNFMPMAPGEVVDITFESGRIVWILDISRLGGQRTFKVEVTPWLDQQKTNPHLN